MSAFASWAFGWLLGLGIPTLVLIGAAALFWFAPPWLPRVRSLAINAVVVAGCWLGMTLVSQSVAEEAVQHAREAVAAAVAVEKDRQRDAGLAALDAERKRADARELLTLSLEEKVAANEAERATRGPAVCAGYDDDDIRRLRRLLP